MTAEDTPHPESPSYVYDELSLFSENASEAGLVWAGPPDVKRVEVLVDPASGRRVRGLLWGPSAPEIVLVHGGAQNAHTWDTTLLALRRPALCLDLPGHGHSDWRDDQAYSPASMADDLAVAIRALAPDARCVVGMSLGGITALELADRHPALVRKLVLVDVTPGVTGEKAKAIIDFISGPQSFPNFAELLARTVEHNPTRAVSSLRRGILHNAHRNADGSWSWNYDRRTPHARVADGASALWGAVSRISVPVALLRGALSPVVDDADVAEFLRRQPTARVEVVAGAGHSIQGDQPVELARLLADMLR